jgi:hypothetical protein
MVSNVCVTNVKVNSAIWIQSTEYYLTLKIYNMDQFDIKLNKLKVIFLIRPVLFLPEHKTMCWYSFLIMYIHFSFWLGETLLWMGSKLQNTGNTMLTM